MHAVLRDTLIYNPVTAVASLQLEFLTQCFKRGSTARKKNPGVSPTYYWPRCRRRLWWHFLICHNRSRVSRRTRIPTYTRQGTDSKRLCSRFCPVLKSSKNQIIWFSVPTCFLFLWSIKGKSLERFSWGSDSWHLEGRVQPLLHLFFLSQSFLLLTEKFARMLYTWICWNPDLCPLSLVSASAHR